MRAVMTTDAAIDIAFEDTHETMETLPFHTEIRAGRLHVHFADYLLTRRDIHQLRRILDFAEQCLTERPTCS